MHVDIGVAGTVCVLVYVVILRNDTASLLYICNSWRQPLEAATVSWSWYDDDLYPIEAASATTPRKLWDSHSTNL